MYNMIDEIYDLDVQAIDQKSHRNMYDKLRDEDSQILEIRVTF